MTLSCTSVSYSQTEKAIIEKRVKIGIIDTGVDVTQKLRPFLCSSGHISLVDDSSLTDSHYSKHGTNVAGLISENLDPEKECLLIIKFYDDSKKANFFKNVRLSVNYAITQKVSYLNMSLGGDSPISLEKESIKEALEAGIKISVAAGNGEEGPLKDKNNLYVRKDSNFRDSKLVKGVEYVKANIGFDLDKKCQYFPACYDFDSKNFHVVGSTTGYKNSYGGITSYSNYGKKVTSWEDGTNKGFPPLSGTSQATAIHTGKWVKEDRK